MTQAGEKDEPHQRLDKIQDDIDDAKASADDLADKGWIDPEAEGHAEPAPGALRPED
jgi:hypothetical protein